MDQLVVPLAYASVRVETDERLGKQIGAGAAAAEEIVARRAERHEDEPALGVEGHRRPGIGMSGEAPRILLRGVVPAFARLRNRVEGPHLLSRMGVEGADVAWWVVAVNEAIAHTVAEDHEVLVDDRG